MKVLEKFWGKTGARHPIPPSPYTGKGLGLGFQRLTTLYVGLQCRALLPQSQRSMIPRFFNTFTIVVPVQEAQ